MRDKESKESFVVALFATKGEELLVRQCIT
jgi:hypothetical protein